MMARSRLMGKDSSVVAYVSRSLWLEIGCPVQAPMDQLMLNVGYFKKTYFDIDRK